MASIILIAIQALVLLMLIAFVVCYIKNHEQIYIENVKKRALRKSKSIAKLQKEFFSFDMKTANMLRAHFGELSMHVLYVDLFDISEMALKATQHYKKLISKLDLFGFYQISISSNRSEFNLIQVFQLLDIQIHSHLVHGRFIRSIPIWSTDFN